MYNGTGGGPEEGGLINKAAESPFWTGLSRVANVIGTGILLPVAGFIAWLTWQNANTNTTLGVNVANIQQNVADIKAQLKDQNTEVSGHTTDIAILKLQFGDIVSRFSELRDFLKTHLRVQ